METKNEEMFVTTGKIPLYEAIARTIGALKRCDESKNDEWSVKHFNTLRTIEKDILPSGSGIDSGVQILEDESTEEKIVLAVAFHHMNDGGMYDGWTEHKVIITPSLVFGFKLKITGRDRNGIKEYLGQVFDDDLNKQY